LPRPKAYNEAELLDQAMHAFWTRGYDRTSIQALVGKTGVNRASLYGAYPDKRTLFVAGIRRYLDLVVEDNVRRLRAIEPAGEAVRQFFLKAVEAPIERLQRGCLMTNSAVEIGLADQEVAELVRGAFYLVEQAIFDRLTEAQRTGEIAKSAEPRALARHLMMVLQGIRVMGRVGVDRDAMRQAVCSALSSIPAGSDARRVAEEKSRRAAKPPRARGESG
jgi:TetR/AcrR family transcriptional repressor of nem operon